MILTPQQINEFRTTIYNYYHSHGRVLPWRKNTNPYSVVVSEIMLQQTQVERVINPYYTFLSTFPDFCCLADAPKAQVLAQWQGLGYYRRALNLQKLARSIVDDYNGILPDSYDTLRKLPGIGPATAGSICAFAFNLPVIFIETNIRRLFIHFFFPAATNIKDSHLFPLVQQTLDAENPRRWYFALTDYGVMLKKKIPNPNRRSAHYAKQSKFEGSDRQLRGRIIKEMVKKPAMTRMEIMELLAADSERLDAIINRMIQEKILMENGELVYL